MPVAAEYETDTDDFPLGQPGGAEHTGTTEKDERKRDHPDFARPTEMVPIQLVSFL